MKDFFIASINPLHSSICNKFYYLINKKIKNDDNLINKSTNE